MATVKVTKEMAEKALRGIDWAAVDVMTDEEVARQVAGNPDSAPILSDTEPNRLTVGERVKASGSRCG